MKSFAALLLCLTVSSTVLAQQLVFPERAATDPAAVPSGIATLARDALDQQQDANGDTYLDARFWLQLAAGQYAEAVDTFTAWRRQHPAEPGFNRSILVELYARTKAAEAVGKVSFEQAFRETFADLFAKLDDSTALDSEYFLETPIVAFEDPFQRALTTHKGKQNMAFADAVDLIRSYLSLEAMRSFAPLLNAAITEDDKGRYAIEDDVLIRTKQGATLSAVVARKKGKSEPLPASLFFNIYTDLGLHRHEAKVAAIHGYVGVAVDTRGKRLSSDEILPWEHEVQDTYGVIDWISRQPWNNGEVGMYGSSYIGFAQWAAAKSLHPALKTIVPSVASFPGFGLPMQNNVFQYANYAWPFYVMNNKYLDKQTYNDTNRWNTLNQKWFTSGRPFREIDAIDGTPNTLLQRQLQHPSFDEYWQAMQPYKSDYAKINIPVLSLTGYYDPANAATVNYLREHYEYNKSANHYLVIGPYNHITTKLAFKPEVVNGYHADPVAQIDSVALTYQWFDYVMKSGPKPALLQDRINYEVMGANVWRHASSIQQMSNQTLRLYLTDTKDTATGRYRLSSAKLRRPGFLRQTVDFADRRTQNNLFAPAAIAESVDPANGFGFVSEPFDAPVTAAGMLSGELRVAINKKDLDVALAVYELMPDGRFFWLWDYVGRASYARDMGKRHLLTPGKVTSIPFDRTQLMSRQLSKGSRLVLLLTVNKNPWAQVNYGTGKDVSDESIADAKEPLEVRWQNDSYVNVPLLR
jgi:putative CocE/NonD family hydrolase